ncbi:MAG: tetratricopeptide repeat protein [Candidatus Obscuribacterales bacterium]|nr:tetratricopeptide repeat protein [Candidatus Obscuribacterales bacterium]
MKKHSPIVLQHFGVALLVSLSCCIDASAQGISEYGGVMAMPKGVPGGGGNPLGGALNNLYGSPYRGMQQSQATRAAPVTAQNKTGSAAVAQTPKTTKGAKGSKAKTPAKPVATGAPVQSGDMPGQREAAQRQQMLNLVKVTTDSYRLGVEAKDKGKWDEAETQLRKTLNLRSTYWADKDKQLPEILMMLGEVNIARGEDQIAIDDLQKALSYYSKFYGPGSDHRIKPLFLLSDLYTKLDAKSEAYDKFRQASQLVERGKIEGYNIAELRLKTAKMALDLEKYREALEFYEKIMSPAESKNLSQDQLAGAMFDYATALKGLNRTRDADAVLAELEKIKGPGAASTPAVVPGKQENKAAESQAPTTK